VTASLFVYNALLALLGPLWVPALWVWPRTRAGLRERWTPLAASSPGTVWIHAASVGEIEAIAPVIADLRGRDVPLRVTTMTPTGRDRASLRFPGLGARIAPLDLRPLIRASLRRAQVSVLVLVETELWPNTLDVACREGVACAVVGGRISDRSFRRYRWLRWLLRGRLRRVSRILARSPLDRDRFVALGADPLRTEVLGELKLDASTPEPSPELVEALGPGPFFLAGSTHAGEEEAVLAAWEGLRRGGPRELRLVLAPRHPERALQVREAATQLGLRAALRSQGAARAEVVVVDTMGELPALYCLADLVFVGGSLVAVGGHNLLEPIRAGRVVLCGPHLENQRAQWALLSELGVLHVVRSVEQLEERSRALWEDPARHAPARRALDALSAQGGAARQVLAWIEGARTLPRTAAPPVPAAAEPPPGTGVSDHASLG
jgi:3-deoxy-D-manno-octulosonic-acid transferase